ncbi:MAG: hypothetical protein ABJ205_08475 [Erythrobacter sp.]|uniref:hypothetical protein n=1 Tax=Erythrobacter sp. TaxID=1042 RepID=UPI0032640C53
MKTTHSTLIWAAGIIAAALYSNFIGLSDAASWAMITGVVGAAYASTLGKSGRCKKACS